MYIYQQSSNQIHQSWSRFDHEQEAELSSYCKVRQALSARSPDACSSLKNSHMFRGRSRFPIERLYPPSTTDLKRNENEIIKMNSTGLESDSWEFESHGWKSYCMLMEEQIEREKNIKKP